MKFFIALCFFFVFIPATAEVYHIKDKYEKYMEELLNLLKPEDAHLAVADAYFQNLERGIFHIGTGDGRILFIQNLIYGFLEKNPKDDFLNELVFQNKKCSLKIITSGEKKGVIRKGIEVEGSKFSCDSLDKNWSIYASFSGRQFDRLALESSVSNYGLIRGVKDVQLSCLLPKNQFEACDEIKVSDINKSLEDSPAYLIVD